MQLEQRVPMRVYVRILISPRSLPWMEKINWIRKVAQMKIILTLNCLTVSELSNWESGEKGDLGEFWANDVKLLSLWYYELSRQVLLSLFTILFEKILAR